MCVTSNVPFSAYSNPPVLTKPCDTGYYMFILHVRFLKITEEGICSRSEFMIAGTKSKQRWSIPNIRTPLIWTYEHYIAFRLFKSLTKSNNILVCIHKTLILIHTVQTTKLLL